MPQLKEHSGNAKLPNFHFFATDLNKRAFVLYFASWLQKGPGTKCLQKGLEKLIRCVRMC